MLSFSPSPMASPSRDYGTGMGLKPDDAHVASPESKLFERLSTVNSPVRMYTMQLSHKKPGTHASGLKGKKDDAMCRLLCHVLVAALLV